VSDLFLVRYSGMSYDEVRRLPRAVYDVLVEQATTSLIPRGSE
jgi:hypothetical protein